MNEKGLGRVLLLSSASPPRPIFHCVPKPLHKLRERNGLQPVYSKSFTFWPTVQFLDNLSALGIILLILLRQQQDCRGYEGQNNMSLQVIFEEGCLIDIICFVVLLPHYRSSDGTLKGVVSFRIGHICIVSEKPYQGSVNKAMVLYCIFTLA